MFRSRPRPVALLAALIAFLAGAAAADGPWQGFWTAHIDKPTILFQDGDRVWGENDSGSTYEGRVSPGGNYLRAIVFNTRNGEWGRVQLRLLAATGEAEGTFAFAPDYPPETGNSRSRAGLVPRDGPAFAPVLTTGPGPFYPGSFDPSSPEDSAWLAFADGVGGVTPQGTGGAWQGLWLSSGNRTLRLRQIDDRVWGDNGDTRLIEGRLSPDGSEMRGIYTNGGSSWGMFNLIIGPDGQSAAGSVANANAIPVASRREWSVTLTSAAEGDLLWATGTGPFWPADLDRGNSDLMAWLTFDGAVALDPPPDMLDFGLWQVARGNPVEILGTARVRQDSDSLMMEIRGEIAIPGYRDGAPLEMRIDEIAGAAATASLVLADGGSDLIALATFEAREGDMFNVTVPPSSALPGGLRFSVVATPFEAGPDTRSPRQILYETDWITRNIDDGMGARLASPANGAPTDTYLPAGAAGLRILSCTPEATLEDLALVGADFDAMMDARWCILHRNGFHRVDGRFLTRAN